MVGAEAFARTPDQYSLDPFGSPQDAVRPLRLSPHSDFTEPLVTAFRRGARAASSGVLTPPCARVLKLSQASLHAPRSPLRSPEADLRPVRMSHVSRVNRRCQALPLLATASAT